MGICTLCGQPAGLLRKQHKECLQKFEAGKRRIISLVEDSVLKGSALDNLKTKSMEISKQSFIDNDQLTKILLTGWENAVEQAFEDGILTEQEEKNLMGFGDYFSFDQKSLDRNGEYTRVIKGAILRDIFEGKIPERIKIEGNIPFNLQKTEKLIWVFQDVDYYEQKRKRQYVGGSRGMSIRIAKGVYYRVGAFKGTAVDTTETVHADNGFLGVTDKHIYFAGSVKSFRIRYDKIVSFAPYSDGIGIQRDATTAKPQLFITGDGWFIYNLLSNVSKL